MLRILNVVNFDTVCMPIHGYNREPHQRRIIYANHAWLNWPTTTGVDYKDGQWPLILKCSWVASCFDVFDLVGVCGRVRLLNMNTALRLCAFIMPPATRLDCHLPVGATETL